MITFLKSLFAWRLSHEAGVYAYFENSVTGHRMACRRYRGGWSPLDRAWLELNEEHGLGSPPSGGSAISRL